MSCQAHHDTGYICKVHNHGIAFYPRHQLPKLVINLHGRQPAVHPNAGDSIELQWLIHEQKYKVGLSSKC